MLVMNDNDKAEFKKEWDRAVQRLRNSRVDLSKIEIMPVQREYKKE